MTDEFVMSLLPFDGITRVLSLRLISHRPFPWSGRIDINGNIRDYTCIGSAGYLQCDFLPRWFADKPLSFPIIYVGLGFILFNLPIGVPAPDPIEQPLLAERVTQLVIIIALMGAGLKIDRPFTFRAWTPSWRLLGIAMPLTIAMTAFSMWIDG